MTCKTWSACWRRRCRGMLRVVHRNLGQFRYATQVTPRPGGCAIVVNYGSSSTQNPGSLETYSPQGELLGSCIVALAGHRNIGPGWTPKALALRGDGTAWMLMGDDSMIVCVRLLGESSNSAPIMKIEIEWDGDDGDEWPQDIALAGEQLLVLCHGRAPARVWFDGRGLARPAPRSGIICCPRPVLLHSRYPQSGCKGV